MKDSRAASDRMVVSHTARVLPYGVVLKQTRADEVHHSVQVRFLMLTAMNALGISCTENMR